MATMRRTDYWDDRDGRAGQSRSHPDDARHRMELGALIKSAHRAQGLNRKRRSFTKQAAHGDWRYSSLQRWAEEGHMIITPVFEGLEEHIPPELATAPEGETPAEERVRIKKILIAIRKATSVTQLAMDMAMDQQYTTYSNFERRMTDFQMAAMQRAVRALGGVYRVEVAHKHNAGLLKRISPTR